MKKGNPEPLTEKERAELQALEAMPDTTIDTSDIPSTADLADGIRGAFYRPIKKPLSLRLDADIIEWFRRGGEGYQSRINAALREYVEHHKR